MAWRTHVATSSSTSVAVVGSVDDSGVASAVCSAGEEDSFSSEMIGGLSKGASHG